MTNWFIKNRKEDINKVATDNNISKVLAKLLINRGISNKSEIKEFLNPDINKMHSPNLLDDLNAATSIIKNKVEKNFKIRIVGDFDVDGIMSVYILYTVLSAIGADVDYVIPDRVLDGYGINNHIVLNAKAQGVDTIITCDNGISAFEPIKTAKNMDMTVIVTDHHDIPYTTVKGKLEYLLPEADAIINPKKKSCKYPFKNLCGAAVAFKLAQNLILEYKCDFDEKDLLEFVALATICDVVDLVGENRTIVVEGLKRLQNTKNIGLNALIETTGLHDKNIGVYHVGFILGPSFNASGRLDSAVLGLSLLLEENLNKATQIAEILKALNEERKKLTLDGLEKIDKIIESQYIKDKVIVVFHPDLHESIAGIIAGRLKEKYNKPTIVLTKVSEGAKGSARSIEEYNIYEELTKCADLLTKYGGHPMAAGINLLEENIEKLRRRLNKNCSLTNKDLTSKTYIDMPYPIQSINESFIREIGRLEPYGKGNPKPIFGDKNANIKKASILGKDKNVLKLMFDKDDGKNNEAIIFRDIEKWVSDIETVYGTEEKDKLFAGLDNNIRMDILFYPSINEYMGNKTIQFIIDDYRLLKH
ncbi:MAG: single-stranded-DNA-specific exonuclease RecJ [Tissierellia bacterium]|nr:single-stranded-DNA-specific exonuclease RecJ [Tissierellia bacterium]